MLLLLLLLLLLLFLFVLVFLVLLSDESRVTLTAHLQCLRHQVNVDN